MSRTRIALGVILFGQAVALAAYAEAPAYPDFTFKRSKPPVSGEKRISVQIDPNETLWIDRVAAYVAGLDPLPAPKVATGEGPGIAGSGDFEWFWTAVSPAHDGSGLAHFQIALDVMAQPPEGEGVSMPRLQRLQAIADQYGSDILAATIGTRVSPALVLAVISVESAGNTTAVSHAGAQGLMQLIPATAERFGVSDSTNATQNIKGGVAYLDWLMKEFDDDVLMALAGYNAGENAVKSNNGVPPYEETRAYVPKVLAAWQVARGLCLTPPELPTDGCVFAQQIQASNE
jgi:Transglycosylase SLT domain